MHENGNDLKHVRIAFSRLSMNIIWILPVLEFPFNEIWAISPFLQWDFP